MKPTTVDRVFVLVLRLCVSAFIVNAIATPSVGWEVRIAAIVLLACLPTLR